MLTIRISALSNTVTQMGTASMNKLDMAHKNLDKLQLISILLPTVCVYIETKLYKSTYRNRASKHTKRCDRKAMRRRNNYVNRDKTGWDMLSWRFADV